MLQFAFNLSGKEVQTLLKNGFIFKNYEQLEKNSVFLRTVIKKLDILYFLHLNTHIFQKEIQKDSTLFTSHLQKIHNQCESIIIEYCLTTHRCQFIFVTEDTHHPTAPELSLSFLSTKIEQHQFAIVVQLSKKELFQLLFTPP